MALKPSQPAIAIAATYAEFFDYSLQIHTPSGPGFTVRVFEGDVETAAI